MEGFAVTCPLAPDAPRLISGFCSSPRDFALSFLRTSSRDDALALWLTFGSADTWCQHFHPAGFVPCTAHTCSSAAAEGRRLERRVRRQLRSWRPGTTRPMVRLGLKQKMATALWAGEVIAHGVRPSTSELEIQKRRLTNLLSIGLEGLVFQQARFDCSADFGDDSLELARRSHFDFGVERVARSTAHLDCLLVEVELLAAAGRGRPRMKWWPDEASRCESARTLGWAATSSQTWPYLSYLCETEIQLGRNSGRDGRTLRGDKRIDSSACLA